MKQQNSAGQLQGFDIIGLKLQAIVNDPGRSTADWTDIRMLLESSADKNQSPDWTLIEDYLKIFELPSKLDEMRNWYERAANKN